MQIDLKIAQNANSKKKFSEKPLNVITLSQTKRDNIKQTITGFFYFVVFSEWGA